MNDSTRKPILRGGLGRITVIAAVPLLLAACPDVPRPTMSGPGALVATSTQALSFTPSDATKTVHIWNGGAPLNALVWNATASADWISLAPSSGLSYGPLDGETMSVSASGGGRDLRPGATLTGEIVVSAVGGVTPPTVVTVEAQSDDGIFAGSNVSSAVAGDFSGDGMPDFAALNNAAGGIDVFLSAPVKGMSGDQFIPVTDPDQLFGLVLVDFTDDGIADLITLDIAANDLVVAPGSASGIFGSPIRFDLTPGGDQSTAFAMADFDVDGRIDVAVPSGIPGILVAVALLERAQGSDVFTEVGLGATLGTPSLCVAADLLGDVRPDVVVAIPGAAGNISIYTNREPEDARKGSSVLGTPTGLSLGGTINALALVDINGDGRRDIVGAVTRANDGAISAAVNEGNGEFSTAVVTTCDDPISMAVGDFNDDEKLDLVVGCSDSSVAILIGAGNGGFFNGVVVPVGFVPSAVRTTDWNGDGTIDVIATDNAGTMLPLLGDGAGGFAP